MAVDDHVPLFKICLHHIIMITFGAIIDLIADCHHQEEHSSYKNSSLYSISLLLFHILKMPFGYKCSKCGDAHREEFVHDVIVKIAKCLRQGRLR